MTEAPEAVLVVAEKVRVDRPDSDPALLGVTPQLAPVFDPVPGNVDGDARAAAGQAMDERRVVDPLPDGPGRAGPRIDVEARPGVAVPPRRCLDLQSTQLGEDALL